MMSVPPYPSRWEVHLAVAKTAKFGVGLSGDTVEIIERPDGGLSVVVADGQRSGPAAKRVANRVVRQVIALLGEGVRDGAAARAASDNLYTERQGKVQASLTILSVDMAAQSVVVVRNTPLPVLVLRGETLETLDAPAEPVGLRRYTRPVVQEYPLEEDLYVLAFTDGITRAGARAGRTWDLPAAFRRAVAQHPHRTQAITDALLEQAVALDEGRPGDDMTLALLHLTRHEAGNRPPVRRLHAQVPLP